MLNKIEEKKIAPKPKWQFLARDYSVWALSAISLIIGSLAFSVILFMVRNNDWEVYGYMNDSLLKFTLLTLPYLWIVFLGLFIAAAHYNYKHTRHGYKHNLPTIVAGSVFISILVGAVLFNIGVGQAIDNVFTEKVPYYEKLFQGRRARWINPERGLLAGQIVTKASTINFEVVDMRSRVWQVRTEERKLHPMVIIEIGQPVRMIGETRGTSTFHATLILPSRPHMHYWFKGYKMMGPGLMKPTPEEKEKILDEIEKVSPEVRKMMEERMEIREQMMNGTAN